MIRSHLVDVQRQRDPHIVVNDRDWLARGPVMVANGRWVPPAGFVTPDEFGPWVGLCEGQPACAWVGPDDAVGLEPLGVDSWFEQMTAKHGGLDVGGEWIERPVGPGDQERGPPGARLRGGGKGRGQQPPPGEAGPGRARLTGSGSTRPPGSILIPFSTRPTGRSFLVPTSGCSHSHGSRALVRSAPTRNSFGRTCAAAVSIGPNCRIGGEVEAAIVHGHSNKYHEGFLGHAYIGEWVNLGAITSNSDLRNDYGEVFVPLQGDPVPTGQAKVGCFIGDHTRTGMGSMLNTGTAIGVMCNVLPAGILLPKHVPSFTAVSYGRVAPGFPLDKLFETARTVMSRRGKTFGEAEEHLYSTLYEQTRLERERAFQRAAAARGDHWPSCPGRQSAAVGVPRAMKPRLARHGYDPAWKYAILDRTHERTGSEHRRAPSARGERPRRSTHDHVEQTTESFGSRHPADFAGRSVGCARPGQSRRGGVGFWPHLARARAVDARGVACDPGFEPGLFPGILSAGGTNRPAARRLDRCTAGGPDRLPGSRDLAVRSFPPGSWGHTPGRPN